MPERSPSLSPKYGFALTEEMSVLFGRELSESGSSNNRPLELVRLQVRDEVNLAHSLTYDIEPDERAGGYWTRIAGDWREGFMIPEGIHHQRCTAALTVGDHLDKSMVWYQAVLEGSMVFDVSPWATQSIITLWDLGRPVTKLIAMIAEMEASNILTKDLVAIDFRQALEGYFAELNSTIVTSAGALSIFLGWLEGRPMSPLQILESIVDIESKYAD